MRGQVVQDVSRLGVRTVHHRGLELATHRRWARHSLAGRRRRSERGRSAERRAGPSSRAWHTAPVGAGSQDAAADEANSAKNQSQAGLTRGSRPLTATASMSAIRRMRHAAVEAAGGGSPCGNGRAGGDRRCAQPLPGGPTRPVRVRSSGAAGGLKGTSLRRSPSPTGAATPDVLGTPAEYKLWVVGDPQQSATYSVATTWFYGPDC